MFPDGSGPGVLELAAVGVFTETIMDGLNGTVCVSAELTVASAPAFQLTLHILQCGLHLLACFFPLGVLSKRCFNTRHCCSALDCGFW